MEEPTHYASEEDKAKIEALCENKMGLYPVTYQGVKTSAIVVYSERADGDIEVSPVAVMLQEGDTIIDPYGVELEIEGYPTKDQ